jgi:hypothetical protein
VLQKDLSLLGPEKLDIFQAFVWPVQSHEMILLPMGDLSTYGESNGEYARSGWFSVARSCRSGEWMPWWQNGRSRAGAVRNSELTPILVLDPVPRGQSWE